jgi:hypothetical protein
MACRPATKNRKVVADLLPGGGNDDQGHGLIAVQKRIPGKAIAPQQIGERAHGRIEHEEPEHAGDGRRDGIRPDQQRAIEALTAHDLVGGCGKKQRDAHRNHGRQKTENHRHLQRVNIVRIGQNRFEVGKADEATLQPKRILPHHGLVQCLTGWPEEEDERQYDLRARSADTAGSCWETQRCARGSPPASRTYRRDSTRRPQTERAAEPCRL